MSNYIKQRLDGLEEANRLLDTHGGLSFILKTNNGAVVGFDTTFSDAQSISSYKYIRIDHLAILTVGYKGDSRVVLNYLHSLYYNWRNRFGVAPSGLTLIKNLGDQLQKNLAKTNAMPLAVKTLIYDGRAHRLNQLHIDSSYSTHDVILAAGKGHNVLVNKLTATPPYTLSDQLPRIVEQLQRYEAIDLSHLVYDTINAQRNL